MIEAIGAVSGLHAGVRTEMATASNATGAIESGRFSQLLASGIDNLEARMERADAVVLDAVNGQLESPHLLMVELEQARVTLQFAVEVRNRMIEGYQEILRMQV